MLLDARNTGSAQSGLPAGDEAETNQRAAPSFVCNSPAHSCSFYQMSAEQVPPSGSPGDQVHTLEHVDLYLKIGQESGCSDIHLGVNAPPIWRRFGQLEPV